VPAADDRTIAFLRELERADGETARVLAELDEVARRVEEIGAEAAEVRDRLSALPAEREAAAGALAEAAREVEERRASHAEAEAAKARTDDPAARRAEVRARDLLHSARRRALHAQAELERLDAEADRRGEEAADLARRARALAAELGERPGLGETASDPPGDTLDDLIAWATETRAALLVARSSLAARRDAVIRQANELGGLVLGEPLVAQTPAAIVRRVESRAG
jgi:hypothetical protein